MPDRLMIIYQLMLVSSVLSIYHSIRSWKIRLPIDRNNWRWRLISHWYVDQSIITFRIICFVAFFGCLGIEVGEEEFMSLRCIIVFVRLVRFIAMFSMAIYRTCRNAKFSAAEFYAVVVPLPCANQLSIISFRWIRFLIFLRGRASIVGICWNVVVVAAEFAHDVLKLYTFFSTLQTSCSMLIKNIWVIFGQWKFSGWGGSLHQWQSPLIQIWLVRMRWWKGERGGRVQLRCDRLVHLTLRTNLVNAILIRLLSERTRCSTCDVMN